MTDNSGRIPIVSGNVRQYFYHRMSNKLNMVSRNLINKTSMTDTVLKSSDAFPNSASQYDNNYYCNSVASIHSEINHSQTKRKINSLETTTVSLHWIINVIIVNYLRNWSPCWF